MDQSLFRLIYRSMKVIRSDCQVAAICSTSRNENAKRELTGVLFHDATQFVQVIEGPLAKIEQVYDAISRDLRHKELLIIEFAPLNARMFDGCTMAIVDAEAEEGTRFTELIAAAGADLTVLPGQQLAELMRSAMSGYAIAA